MPTERPRWPIRCDRGDPDGDPPAASVDAAVAAIHDGETRYQDPGGVAPLRLAISRALAGELRRQLDPDDEVLVTPGASFAIHATIMALTVAGDVVAIPDPGWPTYARMLRASGRRVIRYRVPLVRGDEVDWTGLLTARPAPRLLVVNAPHNPTGGVLDEDALAALGAASAPAPGLTVLADETYNEIVYDGLETASAAAIPSLQERTVIVRSFSKTHAMPAWRVGFLAAPRALAARIRAVHEAINTPACSIAQAAALAAIRDPSDGPLRRARYQRRRDFLVERLQRIPGVSCEAPAGTFYVFPEVSALGATSAAVAAQLAREEEVYVVPGTRFGGAGEHHLRICFARPLELLEELVVRLTRFAHARAAAGAGA